MKKEFRKAVIHYFRTALLQARQHRTQEAMTELLDMSLRAYQKLESGSSCCSLYTFWRFWVYICTDRQAFLTGLFHLLDSGDKDAV